MIELPEMPPRIARLLRDERGYPVPWFVAWVDGKPEFRLAERGKLYDAIRFKLCWVCGQPLGRRFAFVLGPMSAVNRTNAEPPNHVECAIFSAMACPFLTKPRMKRNERDLPDGSEDAAGIAIKRNPGCCAVWKTTHYDLLRVENGILFKVGDPHDVLWFAEGRTATREEVTHSIETGLPILREMAEQDGSGAVEELSRYERRLEPLLPL